VFMIFEITQDYQILVPLMVANLLSFMISKHYQPLPVYHALLHQDGIHLPSPATAATGAGTLARHVMRTDLTFIGPDRSVEEALRWTAEHEAPAYLVGTHERLLGVVTRPQLEKLHEAGRAADRLDGLAPEEFAHAHPDHPIEVVLERLAESDGILPVVSRTEATHVEGVITGDSILGLGRERRRRHGAG
jgi:CIC family chloride channel protein